VHFRNQFTYIDNYGYTISYSKTFFSGEPMRLKFIIILSFILSMFGAHYWATVGPYIMNRFSDTPALIEVHMYSFHICFSAGCVIYMKSSIWKLIPFPLWPLLLFVCFGMSFMPLDWWELTAIRSLSGFVSAALFYRCFDLIESNKFHHFIPIMYSLGTLLLEGSVFISGIAIVSDSIHVAIGLPALFVIGLSLMYSRKYIEYDNLLRYQSLTSIKIESGVSTSSLLVLSVICHCVFFFLILKLGQVFVGDGSQLYIGVTVLVMAPCFSFGAFVSSLAIFRNVFWVIMSLFISIMGIFALYYVFKEQTYLLGIVGAGLFSIGNGMTISKLVYLLSLRSSEQNSYPVRSMSIIMFFTSVLGLTTHIIDLDPLLFIGGLYACCLIFFLRKFISKKFVNV
jgi:hypothetical protein